MNKRIRKKKRNAAILRAVNSADPVVCFVNNGGNIRVYPFARGVGVVKIKPSYELVREIEISGYIVECPYCL